MQATARESRVSRRPGLKRQTNVIQQVASTGQSALGQPLRSRTSGHAIIPIYVPVRSVDGEVEGVFAATLSLESLTTTLLGLQLGPNSRVTVIDNATGISLVSEDPRRILTAETTGRNAASRLAR